MSKFRPRLMSAKSEKRIAIKPHACVEQLLFISYSLRPTLLPPLCKTDRFPVSPGHASTHDGQSTGRNLHIGSQRATTFEKAAASPQGSSEEVVHSDLPQCLRQPGQCSCKSFVNASSSRLRILAGVTKSTRTNQFALGVFSGGTCTVLR